MSRVRPFILATQVSEQWLDDDPKTVRALARESLIEAANELTGPRGGRYVAVNQPYDFHDGKHDDDWSRRTWTFMARVTGRYVRPQR